MITFTVIDREDATVSVTAAAGQRLMERLRDMRGGVEALCGGEPNCTTCHVYMPANLTPHIPPPTDYEIELLECLDSYRANESRLSCQVKVSAAFEGKSIRVVPD
jgi:2Fe-2S ferredoxin